LAKNHKSALIAHGLQKRAGLLGLFFEMVKFHLAPFSLAIFGFCPNWGIGCITFVVIISDGMSPIFSNQRGLCASNPLMKFKNGKIPILKYNIKLSRHSLSCGQRLWRYFVLSHRVYNRQFIQGLNLSFSLKTCSICLIHDDLEQSSR